MEKAEVDAVTTAIDIVAAVGTAIRDIGHPIPEGELYARLMGHISFEQFYSIIRLLKRAGLIAVSNHLITWVG